MSELTDMASLRRAPVCVTRPTVPAGRYIFASPHSGRSYPRELLAASALPLRLLRRSEDAYVDTLFAAAPRAGAPLLAARFPRAFVDPNRSRRDLDPAMFDAALPVEFGSPSARALAGLGVVPRLAADGRGIYSGRMSVEAAFDRLKALYDPYHCCLKQEIEAAQARFGEAILIDCHSMPSASAGGADIVLGDRFGASCARSLTARAEKAFRELGCSVVRNRPYAGGFTTEHYGRPDQGVHVLQIEINRGLYLDEAAVRLAPGATKLRLALESWIGRMLGTEQRTQAAAE